MLVSKPFACVLTLLALVATPALGQQPYRLTNAFNWTGSQPVRTASAAKGACAEDCIGLPPGMPAPGDYSPPEGYQTPLPQPADANPYAPGNPAANSAPSGPLLASSFGAASGARGTAPNMIGDFFGPPTTVFSVQGPSSMVNLGGSTQFRQFGTMGVPGMSRYDFVNMDSSVLFDLDTVAGTPLTDVVFRSQQPLDGITATTGNTFNLDIAGVNSLSDLNAQAAFIQARLNDPDLQAAFLQQQAAYAAANGGGTFTQNVTAANGTVTIDSTNATLTTVTTQPADSEINNFSGSATGTVDSSSTFLLSQSFTFVGPDVQFTPDHLVLAISTPGGGDLLGRSKISDNNSPIPRDRIFLDYNYFQNAALSSSGLDVQRFTPGFEKTFFNGNMSVEMRFPMGITLDNKLVADGVTDMHANEFGDISVIFKALLWTDYQTSFTAGMGVTAPTGADVSVDLANGTQLVRVRNESIHVKPYVAVLRQQGNYFAQAFLIGDFDTNGNPVELNETGNGLADAGTLQTQSLLQFDASVGAWLHRNASSRAYLNGLAATMEVHSTSSISNLDTINSSMFQVVDPNSDFDIINMTFGAHAVFGKTVVTAGYSVPVSSVQSFDGEFRTFVNRYF